MAKDIKTILLTGASKGMGASMVQTFLEDEKYNYRLILVARKSDTYLENIKILKKRYKNEIFSFFCDLGQPKEVNLLLNEILAIGHKIDIVINNAGYTNPISFLDIEANDFRHTMEVNLITPFRIIQKLFQSGNHIEHIVNVASTSGIGARPGWLTYASSKAAMISMSDTLRDELSIFGCKVVCISPGRCATDLRKILAPDEDPSTIMQPENVAEVVNFLISDNGQYITSQNLIIR